MMNPSPGRVLIVDDEPGIRDMLCWELGSLGYETETARNGAEAIDLSARSDFDVIISDIKMPVVDGLELLRAEKRLSPDVEVIIVSGYAELESAIECIRAGAFDLLQKPCQADLLASAVSRAIERRRLRATRAAYESSQAVLRGAEPQELPDRILEAALRAMDADRVTLMIPDSDGGLYESLASSRSGEVDPDVREQQTAASARVAAARAPLVIGGAPGPSSLIYPLVSGDQLLAVLNLHREPSRAPFRRTDLERASVLASQVLLALENARLVRRAACAERLASVGMLTASVAHEICNPASAVVANHSFLEHHLAEITSVVRGYEDRAEPGSVRGTLLIDQTREALRDLGEAASRICDIVRDLKSVARGHDSPAVLSLNEVIRSAMRIARAEIRPRATVVQDLGSRVEVIGSAGRLCQVFVNLLVNAAHAVEQNERGNREIFVRTWCEGEKVFASIRDTGAGIAPEHLRRIFEAFFTTKGASGTGLGLSISREIIQRHGGEITVESAVGEGATFTVTLPHAELLATVSQ